ncbi:MAG: ATP-binding protein, partial [Thermodesulfobacteriota bacterium]|nr:ATP-binding protein [Thermodesulfobacteriota bacterium]
VIEGCQEEAKKKNIVINTNFHNNEVRIHADKFAFERITKNIIFNAIDAIQKDGEILIETKLLTVLETGTDQIFFEEKAANTVAISISDTGCGIPEERLPNLFDDYTTSKRKGLGLGLAISKKLVEDMDGTIEVQSKVDVGTTFTLKFPSP